MNKFSVRRVRKKFDLLSIKELRISVINYNNA